MKKRKGREAPRGRAVTSGNGMGCRRNSGMIRDMGIGCGRGHRMGLKGGTRNRYVPATPQSINDTLLQQDAKANQKEEAEMLKNQGNKTDEQALVDEDRIPEIEKASESSQSVAVVDAQECTACGACEDICPDDAISIDETAIIDLSRCTGCGQCVEECPTEAISLQKV